MKKIILILVVVVAGCKSKTKMNLKPSHNANLAVPYGMSTQAGMHKMTLSRSTANCTSDHRVSFDEACDMISAMLNQNNLYLMDSTYGLGGYIDSTGITSDVQTGEVIQFFPCFQDKTDEVFLCYKDLKGYDSGNANQCDLADAEVLERSTNTFTYDLDRSRVSPGDVASFISTMSTDLSTTHIEETGKDVNVWKGNFFHTYTVNGNDLNKYHCGAMNKCEVLELLNQVDSLNVAYHCIGIRYFFAYDATRENKIRLVLIGVNSDGNNLIHYATGEEAMMMEKEWPPDSPTPMDSTMIRH